MGMIPVAQTRRGNHVWRDEEAADGPLIYVSGMAVDGDGSPHTYHPQNQGLDYLANARDGERWFGVVTRNKVPVLQGPGDPAPGYYVSPTTLVDARIKDDANPRRYVNSETVPFIAFPSRLYTVDSPKSDIGRLGLGVNLGDYVVVYDMKTGKSCGGVFADVGPAYKLGEASIRVAKELGVNPSPKNGGVDATLRIAYVVFPRSFTRFQSAPWPQTPEQVMERAGQLFAAWGEDDGGGIERLKRTLLAISLVSSTYGTGSIEQNNPTIDVPEPGERFRDPELQYHELAPSPGDDSDLL